MRSLRVIWLWLGTSFRAAPLLMTISAVLVAARAITAPTQTYGVSQLVDADLAAESAQLQALQTKQQLGVQSLSIANQGPAAVLALFK